MCEKIVASGATVVVNRGSIYNVAEQYVLNSIISMPK
jgi:hypothetical protein